MRKLFFQFEVIFKDFDIHTLETVGLICSPFPYFCEVRTFVDIRYLAQNNQVYMHIENGCQEEDRYFYDLRVKIMDRELLENHFWSHGDIDIMKMEDLKQLENPLKLTIHLGVGIYEGCGTPDKWVKILTCLDDFTPVVSAPTSYSESMDDLLRTGTFSDLKLICSDRKQLNVHKCLMIECPYFATLLSGNSSNSLRINCFEVEVEYDIMKVIMQFIYSGRIDEKHDLNWLDLYRVACLYGLDMLAGHCQLQILVRTQENIDDVKTLIKFALKYHSKKMIVCLTHMARSIQDKSCKFC